MKYKFRHLLTLSLLFHASVTFSADLAGVIFTDSFERCESDIPLPPDTVSWDGGGDGFSWSDPLNWSNDVIPADGDDVVIDQRDELITVVFNSGQEALHLNNLKSCEALSVAGGTLQVDGSAVIDQEMTLSAPGNLFIEGYLQSRSMVQSGGAVDGPGTLRILGMFAWSGGTQAGPGETTVGYGIDIHHIYTKNLTARTLTLHGNSTWTDNGEIYLREGATINNNGPFDIQTDKAMRHISGLTSTINNTSTITKSAGNGLTDLIARVNNSGSIVVSQGELRLGGIAVSAASSGTFEVAASALLSLQGIHDFTGATFSGDGGLVYLGGDSTTISGAYSLGGPLTVNSGVLTFSTGVDLGGEITLNGGKLEFTASPSSISGNLRIHNGTLDSSVDIPVTGSLTQTAGNLTGSGTVTLSEKMTWSNGTQSGSGETVVSNGIDVQGVNTKNLTARTLTLNGASTWSGTGEIYLRDGAIINNNAPFDIQNDRAMRHISGLTSTINNTSTITKSTGNGLTELMAQVSNSGSIVVSQGDLRVGRAGVSASSSGTFGVATDAFLSLRGTHTMTGAAFSGDGGLIYLGDDSTVISGAYSLGGPLTVQSGVLTFSTGVSLGDDVTVTFGKLEFTASPSSITGNVLIGNGTLDASVDLPVTGSLTQSGGYLIGTGTMTMSDKVTWSNGTQSGSGETVASNGIDVQGVNTKNLTARTLTLNGASAWSGTGEIYLRDGAIINNNAPFDIQNDRAMRHISGLTSTINNTSTITKSTGNGLTELMAQISNSGSIVVSQGDLILGRPALTAASSGTFEVAAGALLSLRGIHDFTGAGFSGDGGLNYLGDDSTTISGAYSLGGPLTVQSGVLTFSTGVSLGDDVTVTFGKLEFTASPSSITGNVLIGNGTLDASVDLPVTGSLTQSGGFLTGSGTMTLSEKVTWSGGTQSGSGETVASDGIDFQAINTKSLTARTLTLNGSSTWSGTGEIFLRDEATINNNSPFDIQNDETMRHLGGLESTLNNTSTITKSAGAGLSDIQATFINSGSINVLTGTLRIDGIDYVP